jgi:hypothetical protein
VRLDTARRFALSLPETTEEPHFDMTLSATDEASPPVANMPGDASQLRARKSSPVDVRYRDVCRRQEGLAEAGEASASADDELLEDAWRAKAPKRVLAAYDASR